MWLTPDPPLTLEKHMRLRPSGRLRAAALLVTTLGLLGPLFAAASGGTAQTAVEVGQAVAAAHNDSGHNWV
jgi:hypothetical protein